MMFASIFRTHKTQRIRKEPTKKGLWFRVIAICCVFLTLMQAIPVRADVYKNLPKGREEFWEENGILFYNSDGEGGNNNCAPSVIGTTKPSGNMITWIGDSYTVQAKNYGLLDQKFPNADVTAEGSKHFYMDVTPPAMGGPSGLKILEDKISSGEQIRPYLVFALGTNDQSGLVVGDTNYIDKLVELVKRTGEDKTIILVTPRTHNYTYEKVISEMNDAAKRHNNIIVADWAKAAEGHLDEYFTASVDAIHPNKTGYEAWLQVIYDALPGGVSTLPGNNAEEMIWNYFATAGIDGVSNNPAVIAGVMGNLMQESTLNPFSSAGGNSGGLYGDRYGTLKGELDKAGLSQYWGQNNAPADAVQQAIRIELDYLTKNNVRWLGTDWAVGIGFITHLNSVSENTPEAYAELFEVAVEGAITEDLVSKYTGLSNELLDQRVIELSVRNFGKEKGGGRYYQEVSSRRSYARGFYDKYVGKMASTSGSSSGTGQSQGSSSEASITGSAGGTGVVWDSNGYLSTTQGYFANKVTLEGRDQGKTFDENSDGMGKYATDDGKPNKILLHSTEGQTSGFNAYPTGNVYPAHFTIDIKKELISQHFSIWEPSVAIAGRDDMAGIQIEIVGFSTSDRSELDYYLPNRPAREWEFLAVVLAAISEQTGIPLTSSLSWANGTPRLSLDDFQKYRGVLGHMHAPGNDHIDPGDIWQYLDKAIKSNPSAAKFATDGGGSMAAQCVDPSSSNGKGSANLVSGGMTKAEAEEFMKVYRNLAWEEYNKSPWRRGLQTIKLDGQDVTIYHSGCNGGPLTNCASFSEYFVNRYTTAGPGLGNTEGSGMVQFLLNSNKGFTNLGHTLEVYSVFSRTGGAHGHTGVVLGIDIDADLVITGEAHCIEGNGTSDPDTHILVHEHTLTEMKGDNYTYAGTSGILKGGF